MARSRRWILWFAAVAGMSQNLAGCAVWNLAASRELVKESTAYEQQPAGATGGLLIVGDSTAVGTGASAPARSLAGLIGADHPRLRIVNRGADGAKLEDIVAQLGGAERFDAVLILGGGNDVIRYSRYEDVATALDEILKRAKARAPNVIFMPMGNVGNAPFFVRPYSWLMEERSARIHSLVRDACYLQKVSYVNLFKPYEADPFAKQPQLYHARDGLHPSDAGYRAWYEELRQQASLEQKLPRR